MKHINFQVLNTNLDKTIGSQTQNDILALKTFKGIASIPLNFMKQVKLFRDILVCKVYVLIWKAIEPKGLSQYNDCRLTSIGIPMLKIKRFRDRLIFNMGIPIPGKDGRYIETRPWDPVQYKDGI